MEDTTVTVIPSSIDVGKTQTVVVIFPCDLPQHQLVTLELCQSSGKRPSPAWVPVQLLGSNVLRANLPEIPYAGDLEVTVKVLRETFDPCPSFTLRVISPLETILQASLAPQKSSSCNGSTSLPCLAAYLLHTHEKDQSKLAHMDRVVTDLLQSQSSLCSDWNLSSVIFGKYGPSESLLHLLVRCKLDGAVGMLLQHRNRGSKEAILQQRDYKGRTPSEIARKKGSKRMAEMLAMANVNSTEGNECMVKKTKMMKSKSLDHKLNLIGTTERDNELLSSVKVNGDKHFNKRRFRLQSDKKGVTLPTPQFPPTPSDDWQFSEEVGLSLPCSPTSMKYSRAIPIPAENVGPLCGSSESLRELVSMCLYSSSVLSDYPWEEPPFWDKASLKKGDIFYVMKELGKDMCHGVCKGFYWTLPKSSLATSNLGDDDHYVDHYEPTEVTDSESSDGYEEVLDPINLPIISGIRSPVNTPPGQVVEMPFKRPPMRDVIRDQGARHSPASQLQLSSEYSLSSSHDSGLEHSGVPRLPSPAHQEHSPAHTGPSSNPPHAISKLAKAKPLPVLPMKQKAAIQIPEQEEDMEQNSPRVKGVPTLPQRKRPSYENREPFPLPKLPEPNQKAPTPPQKRKMVPSLPVTQQHSEPLEQRPRLATPPEESQPFTLGQKEREPTPPKAPATPQKWKILPVPPAIQQQTMAPSDEHDQGHTKQAVHPERKRNVPTPPHKSKVAITPPVVEQTPPEQKKRVPLPPEWGLSKSKATGMWPDPAQRAPEPPGSDDDDEYDDAITFQSHPVTQTQQPVTNSAQPTSATNVSKLVPYLTPEKQSEKSVWRQFKPQQHHHHLPVSPDSDVDEEDYVDASSQNHSVTSQGQQHVERQEPRWQPATKERPRKAPLQPPPARASSSHQQTGAPPPAVKPRGSLPRQRNRPPPHNAASSRHVKDPSSTSGDEDSVPSSFADLRRRLEQQLAS